MQNKTNIYVYVTVLTVITAIILGGLFNLLNGRFENNKKQAKMDAILNCIPEDKGSQGSIAIFEEQVKIAVLDHEGKLKYDPFGDQDATAFLEELNKRGKGVKYNDLISIDLSSEEKFDEENRVYPTYIYKGEGDKKYYVTAVRGNGLWDKIWGYVALNEKEGEWVVAGVNFDHKAETPGLGAEIKDSDKFKDQFKGRNIYDDNGNYVAVEVTKKSIKHPNYQVSAISGATVTSVGVEEMLKRGMKPYLPLLEKAKAGKIGMAN